MHADRRVATIAARQHGVLVTQQVLDAGLTPSAIRHRLRTGRWRSPTAGLYIDNAAPRTWEQHVMAATLTCGADAAASHWCAAALHGFVPSKPERIDVTVPHGVRSTQRTVSFKVHRARTLGPRDVKIVSGIRATCPARTIVDLAGVAPRRSFEALLDAALLSGKVSIAALRRYIRENRLSHLRGVGQLRRLLDDREHGIPESELEREFLRIVRRFRLPVPVRQHRALRFRVDFAYIRERLMVEVDGRAGHGTAEAFTEDRRRLNRLVLEGWTVLHFTWDDVKQRPDEVAQIVCTALRRAPSAS